MEYLVEVKYNKKIETYAFFTDINECKTNNANCAHQCVNTNGSYHCKCHLGYSRNPDNTTCKSIHTLGKHTKLQC